MELVPIVELGIAEAYSILVVRFSYADLPPMEAIENEDWGCDYLLLRLWEAPGDRLAEAGLCTE